MEFALIVVEIGDYRRNGNNLSPGTTTIVAVFGDYIVADLGDYSRQYIQSPVWTRLKTVAPKTTRRTG